MTWLGGMPCSPSALRVNDNTMAMRVKLGIMMSSDGATDNTVSNRMMVTDWLGFSVVSGRLMLIDASGESGAVALVPVPSAGLAGAAGTAGAAGGGGASWAWAGPALQASAATT